MDQGSIINVTKLNVFLYMHRSLDEYLYEINYRYNKSMFDFFQVQ
jgi:hypothetical protein